jgi:hypothetical protein
LPHAFLSNPPSPSSFVCSVSWNIRADWHDHKMKCSVGVKNSQKYGKEERDCDFNVFVREQLLKHV